MAVTAAGSACANDEPRHVRFSTRTMGTYATLTLVTADSAAVADTAYDGLVALHRVDSLMSNWTDTSEIARINRLAATRDVVVQDEVAAVIDYAMRVSTESGGAFDTTVEPLVRLWGFLGGKPRVPTAADIERVRERTGYDKVAFDAATRTIRFARDGVKVDLGGIAKGYGVDAVAEVLHAAGVRDALIDLSGNMVAMGNAAGRSGWTVGIRDPHGERDYLARLRLLDRAVATSGDYEQFIDEDGKRYGHILDPRTGWSARGLLSVTVVAERAMTCDTWATALFVLGPQEARALAAARDDLSVILIEPTESGDVIWVEESLREQFRLADGVTATVRTFP